MVRNNLIHPLSHYVAYKAKSLKRNGNWREKKLDAFQVTKIRIISDLLKITKKRWKWKITDASPWPQSIVTNESRSVTVEMTISSLSYRAETVIGAAPHTSFPSHTNKSKRISWQRHSWVTTSSKT